MSAGSFCHFLPVHTELFLYVWHGSKGVENYSQIIMLSQASMSSKPVRNGGSPVYVQHHCACLFTLCKSNIHSYLWQGYGKIHYIASQGPKDAKVTTIKDFWQMVVEQYVGVIIMVANFVEGEKVWYSFPFNIFFWY